MMIITVSMLFLMIMMWLLTIRGGRAHRSPNQGTGLPESREGEPAELLRQVTRGFLGTTSSPAPLR